MPVDPVTATAAVAFTAKWMWDSYGKNAVDSLARKWGRSREEARMEQEWKQATERYLTKLYGQVNWLRLLGKREGMPLEQIFTDVNVLDKLSAEQWYKLESLQEDFLQRRGFHGRLKEVRQDGLAVVKQFPRLYILGKPGAGKTTFLKYVTLEALKGRLGQKLPLFVSLKELSDAELPILAFMAEQLRQCGFEEAEPFLRQLLPKGDAIVLFDGLDEVNLEQDRRAKQIAAMKAFVQEFDQCQVLITCRLAASDYSFERFRYVEMADFSAAQQKTFVFRWFHDDLARRDACWAGLQGEDKKGLRELAQVPLLLTLLCLTFERRGEFPPDRDEIYRWAVNALLFEWDSSRLIQRDALYKGLDIKYKERLLTWVAAQTFDRGEYLLEEARLAELIEQYLATVPGLVPPLDGLGVLKAIEAHHGLLVERAQGIYSFSHLTLQEYFTARYIVDNAAAGTLPRLMKHVGEDRWREVFLLTAGMLYDAQAFATEYLTALAQMTAQDKTVTDMLQWGVQQSAQSRSSVKPPALRALLIFLHLARARALDLARARALALALVVRDLDLALTRALTRAIARDLDLALELVLARASALDLDDDLDRARDLALDRARDLALALAVTYDWALLRRLPENTAEIVQHVQGWSRQATIPDWLRAALAGLSAPSGKATIADRQTFREVEAILLQHWGLTQFWELSSEQADLLARYLEANYLLLDCLAVASVLDREALEAQMLLPSQQATENR